MLSSSPGVFKHVCDCLQICHRVSRTKGTDATLNTVKSLD